MRFLFDLLTLWGPSLARWTAMKMLEEAEREYLDEGKAWTELQELQARYESGDLGEAEYEQHEEALLQRLASIREARATQG